MALYGNWDGDQAAAEVDACRSAGETVCVRRRSVPVCEDRPAEAVGVRRFGGKGAVVRLAGADGACRFRSDAGCRDGWSRFRFACCRHRSVCPVPERPCAVSAHLSGVRTAAESLRTQGGIRRCARGRIVSACSLLHCDHCSLPRFGRSVKRMGIASLFCPQGAIYIQRRKISAFDKKRHNFLQSKPWYPSRYNKYYITQTPYF